MHYNNHAILYHSNVYLIKNLFNLNNFFKFNLFSTFSTHLRICSGICTMKCILGVIGTNG